MNLDTLPSQLINLVEKGSCRSGSLDELLLGIAHRCNAGKNWVISQRILSARNALNTDNELLAAIVCGNQDVRSAWSRLCAGRSREAGQLIDPAVLVQMITQLGDAAVWVDEDLAYASMTSSEFSNLERSLFGTTANQQQVTPALLRVLAAGYRLTTYHESNLDEIAKIDPAGRKPNINWCEGRLIHLPGDRAREFQYLLSGTTDAQYPREQTTSKDFLKQIMDWVLGHPWAYLLALITYEQNVWQVETSGALLLELPSGQSPLQPSEVQVLVANAEGDEVYCGNLGEYCARALNGLGMALFPATASVAELNARLSAIIGDLLSYKVWQYVEGLSGMQGYYQIHPEFSDLCYGIQGQPSFSRYARELRRVIRNEAIAWRHDRQTNASKNTTNLTADAA